MFVGEELGPEVKEGVTVKSTSLNDPDCKSKSMEHHQVQTFSNFFFVYFSLFFTLLFYSVLLCQTSLLLFGLLHSLVAFHRTRVNLQANWVHLVWSRADFTTCLSEADYLRKPILVHRQPRKENTQSLLQIGSSRHPCDKDWYSIKRVGWWMETHKLIKMSEAEKQSCWKSCGCGYDRTREEMDEKLK